jgi:hypothetical protein
VLALNLQAASSIAEYLYRADLTRLTPYTVDRVCRFGHMKKPEVREGATRILERLGPFAGSWTREARRTGR